MSAFSSSPSPITHNIADASDALSSSAFFALGVDAEASGRSWRSGAHNSHILGDAGVDESIDGSASRSLLSIISAYAPPPSVVRPVAIAAGTAVPASRPVAAGRGAQRVLTPYGARLAREAAASAAATVETVAAPSVEPATFAALPAAPPVVMTPPSTRQNLRSLFTRSPTGASAPRLGPSSSAGATAGSASRSANVLPPSIPLAGFFAPPLSVHSPSALLRAAEEGAAVVRDTVIPFPSSSLDPTPHATAGGAGNTDGVFGDASADESWVSAESADTAATEGSIRSVAPTAVPAWGRSPVLLVSARAAASTSTAAPPHAWPTAASLSHRRTSPLRAAAQPPAPPAQLPPRSPAGTHVAYRAQVIFGRASMQRVIVEGAVAPALSPPAARRDVESGTARAATGGARAETLPLSPLSTATGTSGTTTSRAPRDIEAPASASRAPRGFTAERITRFRPLGRADPVLQRAKTAAIWDRTQSSSAAARAAQSPAAVAAATSLLASPSPARRATHQHHNNIIATPSPQIAARRAPLLASPASPVIGGAKKAPVQYALGGVVGPTAVRARLAALSVNSRPTTVSSRAAVEAWGGM